MANKKKDADEIIVELNRDVERLTRRVTELETELEGYRSREKEIASAMTLVAQMRENIINDAEKVASSMTHNAEKTAQGTISAAQDEAKRIIADARAKADIIKEEAREEAAKEQKALEKRNAETIAALNNYAKDVTAQTDAINEAMVVLAAKMYSYITKYKDVYERVSGKKFGDIEQLPKKGGQKKDTAEDYDNPEDLYHAVMEIEGRTPPEGVGKTDGKKDTTIPETVPLTADMLGTGNPEEKIASVIDMSDDKEAVTPKAEEKQEDVKAQQETAPVDESVTDDTDDTDDDEGELESMLTCFMDDLDDTKADDEKAEEDELDDLLDSISGDAPKDTEQSDELSDILDGLLGDDDGEGAEG